MTLKELAQRAGLHPSTVSRVLNDDPRLRLSAPSRERVLELARLTNYRPNHVARSLKRRQTLVLGVLIPDVTNPLFASLFRGVEDVAFQRGYNALLCSTDDQPARFERHLRLLFERQVDGVILATARRQDPAIERLVAQDEPFVLVNRRTDASRDRYVVGDDLAGARLATEHLISIGRRRIAHLAGPESVMTGYLRSLGYRQALEGAGLPFDRALVVETDFTEAAGRRSARTLLERGVEPDAIFAVNDMAALGALDVLRERGLRTPEDVALVGFNDVPIAARVAPALTTVRIPLYDMGATAAGLLLDRLGDRQAPPPAGRLLEPSLVVRASTVASAEPSSEAAKTPSVRSNLAP